MNPISLRLRPAAHALAAAALLGACSNPAALVQAGLPDTPPSASAPGPVAAIEITATDTLVGVVSSGAAPRLSAVLRDAHGRVVPGGVTWSSADPTRLAVAAGGELAALVAGARVELTARAGDVTSTLAVRTVVYRNDLSASPTGVLDVAAVRAAWNTPGNLQGVTDGRVSVVDMEGDGGPSRALRVRYPHDGVGPDATGALWVMPLGDRYDELYVSYRVRFAPGFGFAKGGKLPGLAGGVGNSGGNRPNGRDGWSARIMWMDAGRMVQYVYHPDQSGAFGDGMIWKDAGKEVHTSPGTWYTLVSHVRMNTPGHRDGIVQAWLDGRPVLDRRNLRFRDVDAFAIDQFQFSTFFGGSTPDYAAPRDETIDFADFVISPTPPPGLGS